MTTKTSTTDQPGLRAVPADPAADLAAARADLEKAQAEAAEAQQLIDTLEEQVREGSEAVDADVLGREYGVRRLAELRKEAAEQRAKEARAALAVQRRAAALRDAETELDAVSLDRLADLHAAAYDALLALAEATVRRRRVIAEQAAALAEVNAFGAVVSRAQDQVVVKVGGVVHRQQDAPVPIVLPRLLAQVSGEASTRARSGGAPDLHAALYQWVSGSPTPLEQLAAERRAAGAA
jgi:hypothetical protein